MKELFKMEVAATFTEGVLATKSGEPELLREYIASKHPEAVQEDEIATLPDLDEELEHGTSVFNRDDDGTPFIFDYQLKGFFKDVQGAFNRLPGSKMQAHKKTIDGLIFVFPRRIRLELPEGAEVTICERPIRVQGPQGEKVAIARSEEAPVGTTLAFTVKCLDRGLIKVVEEWLDYGQLRGLGQWRNSGKGTFVWKLSE